MAVDLYASKPRRHHRIVIDVGVVVVAAVVYDCDDDHGDGTDDEVLRGREACKCSHV